jgi:ribosomal protein L37E
MIAYPPGYESKPEIAAWRCSYCGREWPMGRLQCGACGAGREARRREVVEQQAGDDVRYCHGIPYRLSLAGTAIK